jgi:hypothetical protein
MDQILADDFVLVTGRGKVYSKAGLIDSARKKEVTYESQDEEPGLQKIRAWGDTAVVTVLLWIKSGQGGKPADYKLWFSDTYVRTTQAGATCSAKLPCLNLKRSPSKIRSANSSQHFAVGVAASSSAANSASCSGSRAGCMALGKIAQLIQPISACSLGLAPDKRTHAFFLPGVYPE